MPTDPRLLLPLDWLPEEAPVGLPCVVTHHGGALDQPGVGKRGVVVATQRQPEGCDWLDTPAGTPWVTVAWATDSGGMACGKQVPAAWVALDLTPRPGVVDALPVVAGMVRDALGIDPACGADVSLDVAGFYLCRGEAHWSRDDLPTLADIDPTDPLAARLALVEVVRAAPWSAP